MTPTGSLWVGCSFLGGCSRATCKKLRPWFVWDGLHLLPPVCGILCDFVTFSLCFCIGSTKSGALGILLDKLKNKRRALDHIFVQDLHLVLISPQLHTSSDGP